MHQRRLGDPHHVNVRRDVPAEMEHHATLENYVPRILADLGFASSLSDAWRGIKGGGVRVDGATLAEEYATLGEGTWVLQFGRRRFARVAVTPAPWQPLLDAERTATWRLRA